MRILLTGTEGSGIDRAGHVLRIAGHETAACILDTAERGRCRAADDPAACPFVAGVDVIVAAREHPLPHLSRQELLVSCATLRDVPLVVVGATITNPYGSRAAVLVDGFDQLASACEALVAAAPRRSDGVAVDLPARRLPAHPSRAEGVGRCGARRRAGRR